MSEKDVTVAIRLWRDRVQIREQERNDAQARLELAEERIQILEMEINRLIADNIRLRAQLSPRTSHVPTETEQQMAELRGALMPLLDQPARA